MNIEDFLSEAFPYAESTKRTYRDVIPRILSRVPDPSTLTSAELLRLLAETGWGNKRQHVGLAAVRKYLTWMYGHQHPTRNAKLKRIEGEPQRALDRDTALRLLASFDAYSPKGARDLAICSLDLDTGLREAELCGLLQADVDTKQRVLQVLVKGGQWKAAVFAPETAAHIERWKSFRRPADGQGFLFVSMKTGIGLKPEGLYSIVREWGWKIGITLSPHDLRRTMAVLAWENGASDRSLMEMGRWETPAMVKRYTRTLRLEATRKYLVVSSLLRDSTST